MALNRMKKNGIAHRTQRENAGNESKVSESESCDGCNENQSPEVQVNADRTYHAVYTGDATEFLKTVPDSSIDLILIDPPYNLDLAVWDTYENYLHWARTWLDEIFRILKKSGNCVIFGGFQFQDLKKGDLLEILHYTRHHTPLRFVNLIIWHYRNGMSAHRFFANRHEEAVWLSKTDSYYFDLDSVRVPYGKAAKKAALRDKRLVPENIEKGKNPTNVWEIPRLSANSKERTGHPTQKPSELIRRFVRALSYKGATVLDFFAGSGTCGRVCIEEGRNSILVDTDSELISRFKMHCSFIKPGVSYEVVNAPDINEFLKIMR